MAVTHFADDSHDVADLTLYAELHNATDSLVKGEVSGSAAGANITQTVELAPHEDRTVVFTPQEFPQLRIHHPQLWWPRQMGDPHLEQLTMHFTTQGRVTDEQAIEFGIREITSELTAQGARLFRVNGKRILIRGGGWAPDMLLRPDENRLRDQFRMVRDLNLNTIRLEGKLETDDFFRLADERGILILAGWCCCDRWEDWKNWNADDLMIATASLRAQMLRLRSHASLLVWLNGSMEEPSASTPRQVPGRRFCRLRAANNFCPIRKRGRPRPSGASIMAAANSLTLEPSTMPWRPSTRNLPRLPTMNAWRRP
jgi:exo-1,4-beta-D-glucosaminidase